MYYPLMINIDNKNIVVIGGGMVAFRKVKKLLEFGACVTVISPHVLENFNSLKVKFHDKLKIIEDYFKSTYIENAYLVIGATSDKNINEEISNYCRNKKILCNIVDNIEASDFIVPSSIKRGDLVISVSTMGKSPMLCSKIRKELEDRYTDIYEEYIFLLGEARNIILQKFNDEEKRQMLKLIINMNIDKLKKFIEDNK
ncbi:precorrin-2 dehydrogenase/sirohydrochlorin ferrochelatase family protein [Clostridium massiliodielmoense]|uniref:precorrin-2 dehydrogenase/sirohydrochlorin ferrochelatase family protein n=1 Tax=Clostridium massiliodielmoense TaxID=1776385 RepID=UPI000A26D366|nr:bifunctional precorrin-2 dehydrogenase/sirohydrochlorin ferrochelatase [Clostridium massiliodielmoense]